MGNYPLSEEQPPSPSFEDVDEPREASFSGNGGRDPSPDDEIHPSSRKSVSHSQQSSPKTDTGKAQPSLANANMKQEEHPIHDDHKELNREIALRNETITGLRREVGKLQAKNEHHVDEMVDVQTKSLRSELDSVRSTLVDMDDAHRAALEKHDEALRVRDEEVQRMSRIAHELREKLQAFEEGNEQDLVKHEELVRSKDEEIQKLTSH